MELRNERPADRIAVREVIVRAFGAQGAVVADLVDDLRATVTPDSGLSLVAEHERRIVGHIMFTRNLLDAPQRLVDVGVLSPLAVAPEHQGQGIGAALIRAGLELLAAQAVPLVFLEGDPGYYRRLGFTPGEPDGFRKPSLRIPDAAFQVVKLRSYEPWMTGTLVYSHLFWQHDCVGLRD